MFFPEVVQAIPYEDYTVEVLFQNGKVIKYDAKPLLKKGVFSILQDKNYFLSRCTVMNHTLAWDVSGNYDASSCLDLDPESLYYQM